MTLVQLSSAHLCLFCDSKLYILSSFTRYYVSAVFKPPIILLEKIPLKSPMYVSTNEMEFTPFIFLQPFLWWCLSFSLGDAAVRWEREGPFLARRHLSSFSEVRTVVMYGRLQFFFWWWYCSGILILWILKEHMTYL